MCAGLEDWLPGPVVSWLSQFFNMSIWHLFVCVCVHTNVDIKDWYLTKRQEQLDIYRQAEGPERIQGQTYTLADMQTPTARHTNSYSSISLVTMNTKDYILTFTDRKKVKEKYSFFFFWYLRLENSAWHTASMTNLMKKVSEPTESSTLTTGMREEMRKRTKGACCLERVMQCFCPKTHDNNVCVIFTII